MQNTTINKRSPSRKQRIIRETKNKIFPSSTISNEPTITKHRNSKHSKKDMFTKHHKIRRTTIYCVLFMGGILSTLALISLLWPTSIGIDSGFQDAYKTEPIIYLFVYGKLINHYYRERIIKEIKIDQSIKALLNNELQKITYSKNELKVDHELEEEIPLKNRLLETNQILRKRMKSYFNENDNDPELDKNTEYPVRIHYLKRGWYFDTNMNISRILNENENKNKKIGNITDGDSNIVLDNDVIMNSKKSSYEFTDLGLQFNGKYDSIVNGLLIRIDRQKLKELDIGIFKSYKRQLLPIQYIDFLYSQPMIFKKFDQEINHEKQLYTGHSSSKISSANVQTYQKNREQEKIFYLVKKNAQNMIDIEHNFDIDEDLIHMKNSQMLENNNDEYYDIIRNLAKHNQKRFNIQVWSYFILDNILIKEENAQFLRIMKQSLIDICIAGCLDIGGYEFAKEFIENTYGWTSFKMWDYDRNEVSVFPDVKEITEYEYKKIDGLLNEYVFGSLENKT